MFVKSLGFCVLCTWPLRPLARNVFPSFPGPFWLCAGFFNRNGAQHSSGQKTLAALRGNSGVQHKCIFQKKIVPLCLAKVDRLGHSALKSSSQVYRELDFSALIRK